MSKKWYLSKTLWVNVIAFVVAVLSGFGLVGELDPSLTPFVVPVIAIINFVLRLVTNKSITS